MMKLLRKLLVFFAAIVILVYLIGFIFPKRVEIEKSINVNANIDSVFNKVCNLNNVSEWIPWTTNDPNLIITFEGEPNKVGSVCKWKGGNGVGIGSMEIVSVKGNEEIGITLSLTEPYKSKSVIYIILNGKEERTELLMKFIEKTPIPRNVTMAIFGYTKKLSAEFDKGLENLKDKIE